MNMDTKPLTAKEALFVRHYIACGCNASEAARLAGYSEKAARYMGYENLTKPHIQAEVKRLLSERAMPLEEAIKAMGDIARTRLNDYFVIKKVEKPTKVEKPLSELIDEIEDKIAFEEEYADVAGLDEDERKVHDAQQKQRRREIVRLRLELKRNPNATRTVDGPPEIVEEVELDLVEMAKDKELGRIDEFKYNEFGPVVKLPSAANALDKIIQLYGGYKQVPGDAGGDKSTNVYILPDGTKIEF